MPEISRLEALATCAAVGLPGPGPQIARAVGRDPHRRHEPAAQRCARLASDLSACPSVRHAPRPPGPGATLFRGAARPPVSGGTSPATTPEWVPSRTGPALVQRARKWQPPMVDPTGASQVDGWFLVPAVVRRIGRNAMPGPPGMAFMGRPATRLRSRVRPAASASPEEVFRASVEPQPSEVRPRSADCESADRRHLVLPGLVDRAAVSAALFPRCRRSRFPCPA
jgi:hypothetical protein